MKIELDGELRHRVVPEDARPLVFTPHVDLSKLSNPSIIDDF